MSANIPQFSENALDSIPTASLEQHAADRAYVTKHAADLLSVIFGASS